MGDRVYPGLIRLVAAQFRWSGVSRYPFWFGDRVTEFGLEEAQFGGWHFSSGVLPVGDG